MGVQIRGWCTFSRRRLRLTGEFCLRIRIRWRSMVRCTFSRVLIFAGTPVGRPGDMMLNDGTKKHDVVALDEDSGGTTQETKNTEPTSSQLSSMSIKARKEMRKGGQLVIIQLSKDGKDLPTDSSWLTNVKIGVDGAKMLVHSSWKSIRSRSVFQSSCQCDFLQSDRSVVKSLSNKRFLYCA